MIKTYIAALTPLRYEALLGRDGAFAIVGSGTGEDCAQQMRILQPDFLLLESVLAGEDSLRLLSHLADTMTAPPRVLYLAREKSWLGPALDRDADEAILSDTADEALLTAAKRVGAKPLPALAARWEEERKMLAEDFSRQLGIAEDLKGKQYIQTAAALLSCAPQLAASYSGRLYPLIASRFASSSKAVERAIRTAVEHTWLYGNLDAIQTLFGYSVDADRGKPTNAEFLSMLAGHITRSLAHRMGERIQEKYN